MKIRKGTPDDIDSLESLYHDLTGYLSQHINYPGWVRDVYPVRQNAEDGIRENALFVVEKDDKIIGTFMLKQYPEPEYDSVNWKTPLTYNEIYVVYTLAVHPDYLGAHVGDYIMEAIVNHAKKANMKAVRLDVYEKNTPAIKLYEKHGFAYIGTVDLGYAEYGLPSFRLYQLLL